MAYDPASGGFVSADDLNVKILTTQETKMVPKVNTLSKFLQVCLEYQKIFCPFFPSDEVATDVELNSAFFTLSLFTRLALDFMS